MAGENPLCCPAFILPTALVTVPSTIGDAWCVTITPPTVRLRVAGSLILIVTSVVTGNGVCCGTSTKGGLYSE